MLWLQPRMAAAGRLLHTGPALLHPRSVSHRPAVLAHRPVEVDRSHDSRLVAALYNATFSGVGWGL